MPCINSFFQSLLKKKLKKGKKKRKIGKREKIAYKVLAMVSSF